MKKNLMNILIQLDDNYVDIACVMLCSLFVNNECNINVYLLYDKLNKSGRDLLKKQCKEFSNTKRKCKLIPKKIDGSFFQNYKMRPTITNTAFYKLIAFKYLPKKVEKILYMDVDLIVKGNIWDLYDMDFDNSTLFFAGSECEDSQAEFERLGYDFKKMSEKNNFIYVNSGVLLINVSLMRAQVEIEDIVTFIEMKKNYMRYKDQDVVNGLFFPNIKYFDAMKYNYINFLFTLDKSVLQNIDNAKVLHFAGPSVHKPWRKEYYSFKQVLDIYKKYASQSINKTTMLRLIDETERNLEHNQKTRLEDKLIYDNNFR